MFHVIEEEIEIEGVQSIKFDTTSFLKIALSHRGKSDNVEFETAEESLGTLVWLGLVGPVLDALVAGTVLLVDELESSLHPALVKQLVRIFQNQRTNPNGAQLIFNSFEASLLGNSVDDRILGRDQVWFTEKLHDGSTRIYPLTDLGPRKAEAVTRRYLDGRYGATPIISDAEFDALAAKVSSGSAE
jgi:AAA15 family ATPase/GTPase